jgi:CRP/FNR family cyclic AMP-dependent transcriptional regulator
MDFTLLRQIKLFRGLDSVQISHLATIIEERLVPRNTVLFREGDPAEHFFIIASGRIRISKIVPGAGEEALAILDAGTYFGEMEMLDSDGAGPDHPRAAQAIAHEKCQLLCIRYTDFRQLLKSDLELANAFLWNMVRTLSERLRATNDKVTTMFALAQF